MAPILLHLLLLFLIASIRNRSIVTGVLALVTSYTQLVGYGAGFMSAFWRRIVMGRDEYSAFNKNFYN